METAHRNQSLPLLLVLCISLLTLGTVDPSMGLSTDDLKARANAALQAEDWSKAAALYAKLTDSEPENAGAWYRLGRATVQSGGDRAAGRAAFEKALELGFAPPGPALFGIARSYALDADSDAVVKTLGRLADQGPAPFVVSQLKSDETFRSLSNDKDFKAIVKRLTPCTSEEYRQFDFWLGSWNVANPRGQHVGTNVVTQTLDGCMLIENWESARGGKGMSINYYDRDQKTWSQIYRDNTGNITQWPELKGNFIDGSMVLDSGPDTQPRTRWVWTKQSDGKVRQMAESSSDKGKTWTVVWDSYYALVNE